MRSLFAVPLPTILMASLIAGCTAYIPVKDDFGVSALQPVPSMPPEFAEFNNYDPKVDGLLADQICATPHTDLEERWLQAEPGQLNAWRSRCNTYRPTFVDP